MDEVIIFKVCIVELIFAYPSSFPVFTCFLYMVACKPGLFPCFFHCMRVQKVRDSEANREYSQITCKTIVLPSTTGKCHAGSGWAKSLRNKLDDAGIIS